MKRKFMRICAVGALLLSLSASAENIQVDMLAVDHRLYELGYRDGACNGILDEVTVRALKNFQIVNGLEPTGEPNTLTVNVLLSDAAISQQSYLNGLAQKWSETPSLAAGAYGEKVSALQKRLKALGYFSGGSDGAYGAETQAAVLRFQLANGLDETGIADASVQNRLYSGTPISWKDFIVAGCASAGDSGANVRRLQLWLREKGYFSGECTGRYGDGTQQAVRRFQLDNDLEPSGDLDAGSCEKLYWDVNAFLQEKNTIQRGDTGAQAEDVCRQLAILGYPAHGRFNMQTELALMQFQLVNGLNVTGVADEATLARLYDEGATRAAASTVEAVVASESSELNQKFVRRASALLGQYSELDNSFAFVQYVALKCGVGLTDISQLSRTQVGEADYVEPGALLGVIVQEREVFGVAGSDGALIYRADNGYIVMGYLDAMGAENVCLYHLDGEV